MSRHSIRPALLTVIGCALVLAGCQQHQVVSLSWPDDYRDRHPITVDRGPVELELDVAPGARALTKRQREAARAFAGAWRSRGEGPIKILMPAGSAAHDGKSIGPDIRHTLVAAGVPEHAIIASTYLPGNAASAPVRLKFLAAIAVTNPCGIWPENGRTNIENASYYNFGCASQQNLAAQVAEPRDFVGPRPMDPPYATRRQTVVDKYGKGESTATVDPNENKGTIINIGQ